MLDNTEIGTLRETLAQEPVGILVAPTLPRTVGVTEVDPDKRAAQLCPQFRQLPGERRPHMFSGTPVGKVQQHHRSTRPLDQGAHG